MEREQAYLCLKRLEGADLRPMADKHQVTVWLNGKLNKGWCGHVLERYLGLPINSSQSPNFGSWELKLVSLKKLRSGIVAVKETMAITMIDPVNVAAKPFEESHLLAKLKKAIVCARLFEDHQELRSCLVKVTTFDLGNQHIYKTIRDDYELVRETISKKGFQSLSGAMGTYVQPRTKGPGHGSTSRAFYARKILVSKILGMEIKESV
ncbi:MAG TPA: MvaI/BcnI family restriction endonuclease [Candidatus Sulfotelmatobacter sp.]|nr:MvaI/BcnI family restriction endonuclease [Candidatus Sulfotelmatobacter sp.]